MKIGFRAMEEADWPTVVEHTNALVCQDTSGIVAVNLDNEDVIAAAVFDNWQVNSVSIHVAIIHKAAIRSGFLEEVFNYVFTTSDRKMIFGFTPSNNERALKFIKHLGFEEVYRMEQAIDDDTGYVITLMKREDCRWINDGKEEHSKAS